MSETSDRINGVIDETVGKAKRAIGKATDRPDLVAEGNVQEAKGDAEKAAARVKAAVKD